MVNGSVWSGSHAGAIVEDAHGFPDAFCVAQMSTPETGDNEVLARVLTLLAWTRVRGNPTAGLAAPAPAGLLTPEAEPPAPGRVLGGHWSAAGWLGC